ncbi:ATP-binding protein [Nonomuraea fuscirosea]|uniref:ATP-binding protein n=1 Tax=Nonomuraea fuscirosea TaxID=1291556 RepID=UPI000D070156|nr:ATP-binding protein [Nonomuraea fuscirosea]
MGTSWPFAGREQELGHLLRLARDPTAQGVIVTGPPGAGKSALAARLAVRLGGAFTVRASRALRDVPGGSPPLAYGTASGCGGTMASAGGTGHCGGRTEHAGLESEGGGGCRCSPGIEVLTLVDDAHLLDSHSAEVLAALVRARRIRLIATVCSEEDGGGPVVGSWRDGRLRRFELDPLGKADMAAVLATALNGPADDTVVTTLAELTGGNALWLRELVHAMRTSGALQQAGGVWRLSGDPPPAYGPADLVDHRVGSLPDGAGSVLEYATFGEPIGVRTLAGLCSEAAVLEALELGVIEVTHEARGKVARPVHPLYGEAARARCPAERRTQRYADLVAAVESDLESPAETAIGTGVTHGGQLTAQAAAGPTMVTPMKATTGVTMEATSNTTPEATLEAALETTLGATAGAPLGTTAAGAAVEASSQAVEARRSCDAARVAAWRLAGGLRADAGTLAGACRLAEAVHDHASAIRLGRAAMREGGGAGAAIELAAALNGAGQPNQAHAVLSAAADARHARRDDQERVRLTLARARTLAWGLDRLGDALDLLSTTRKDLRDPEPRPDPDPARTSPPRLLAARHSPDETNLDQAGPPHQSTTDRTEPPDETDPDRAHAPDETNLDRGSSLHRTAAQQMTLSNETEADPATLGWRSELEGSALRHELDVERVRLLAEAARPEEALRAVEQLSSDSKPPCTKGRPPQRSRCSQGPAPSTSLSDGQPSRAPGPIGSPANDHPSQIAQPTTSLTDDHTTGTITPPPNDHSTHTTGPIAPPATDHTRQSAQPTRRSTHDHTTHTAGAITPPADDRVSLALALALCHQGRTDEAVAVLRDVLPAVQAGKPQKPPRPQESPLTHSSPPHEQGPAHAGNGLAETEPTPPWTSAHMTWALCGWFAGDLVAVERAIASMGPGWPGTSEQALARARLALLRGELGAALFLLRAPARHETPLAAAERRTAYAMAQALRGDAAGARASLDMSEAREPFAATEARASLGAAERPTSLNARRALASPDATEGRQSLGVTGALASPDAVEERASLNATGALVSPNTVEGRASLDVTGTALSPDAARVPVTWTALRHWVALAEVWVNAAAGRRSRAVDLALAHAEECRAGGSSSFEAVALHDAVRLGAPVSALPRLAVLAATHDGLRVRLALRHAEALAGADADALTAVADDYGAAGLWLFASEAEAQAKALQAGSAPSWRPHPG